MYVYIYIYVYIYTYIYIYGFSMANLTQPHLGLVPVGPEGSHRPPAEEEMPLPAAAAADYAGSMRSGKSRKHTMI